MAKRRKVTTEDGVKKFYSIETPIGLYQHNKRKADVELVQVFLKQYFQALKHKDFTPPTRKGAKVILIDGIVGPQTLAAIKLFQTRQKTGGRNIATDGIINIPISDDATAPTSTMWILNRWFYKFGDDKDKFDNLKELPDVRFGAYSLFTELSIPVEFE